MTTEPRRRVVFVAANPSIDRLHEVERIEPGRIHRPDRVVAVPGGKGLNASRAAATLGGSVSVVAVLGGHAGAWIRDGLAARGIDARSVDVPNETRTCLSVLDRSTGELTEFYETGPSVPASAQGDVEAAVRAALDAGDVDAIAISGSLPAGMPPDGYARLIALASERSAISIVDTHGKALRLALAARPAVVKVNADEAAEASGVGITDARGARAAAERLAADGPRAVIVTLGAAGAVAHDASGSWHLSTTEPPGRYPVGSGDAFLGGLTVGLVRGDTLVDAALLAMAAGIANAAMAGAGELDSGEVDRLRPHIRVEPM